MSHNNQIGDEPDWNEQPVISDPENDDHFQHVIPLGATPDDIIHASAENGVDTSSMEVVDTSDDVDDDDYVTVNDTEYPRLPGGSVTFYDRHRHVLEFIEKLWKPRLYTVNLLATLACVTIPRFATQRTEAWLVSITALTIIFVCSLVYPTMRTCFWWHNRRIIIRVENRQVKIYITSPKSKFYLYTGSDSFEFTLKDDVSVNLRTTSNWELLVFRKSGGGNIDTKLQGDEALRDLRHVYRPDLLRQAVNDAMTYAANYSSYQK